MLLARRSLSFFVFTAAVACGSSSSGGFATDADGGTSSPAADGAVSSGTPRRPDPGTPPRGATGIFIISRMAGNDGKISFDVAGRFQTPAQNLEATAAKEHFAGYKTVPLDGCVDLARGLTTQSSDQPSLLDGGDVRITPPGQPEIVIHPTQFTSFVFYESKLPPSAFTPWGQYSFSGGKPPVAAVQGSFWAPGPLTLTKPVLPVADTLKVRRDAPFEVTWTSEPDGGPVMLYLMQKGRTITCRLVDDGSFSVPTSALRMLDRSDMPGPGSGTRKDQIAIERYSWYAVPPQSGDAAAGAIVGFETGATLDVSFE